MINTPAVVPSIESVTFPEMPKPLVARDNVIDPLRSAFSSDSRAILLIGPPGSGKTTILAQFVQANRNRCISFFVGNDYWSSSPEYFVWDLCQQMRALLQQKPLGQSTPYLQLKQDFARLIAETQRYARQGGQPLFFVIDGLDSVQRSGTSESILDLLPPPRRNMYVLASARSAAGLVSPGVSFQERELVQLSTGDTAILLDGLGLTASQVERIRKAADGLPAYVAEVRQQIESGVPVDDLLSRLPPALSGLLEPTWQTFVTTDELRRNLAVLVFSSEAMSVNEWASVIGVDAEQASEWASRLSFLTVDSTSKALSFRTNAYRQFAEDKLSGLRAEAESLLIKHYQQDPYGERSLVLLPSLLQRARRPGPLKAFVNDSYLLRTLGAKKDLSLLRSSLVLASDAAFETKGLPAMLRFASESGVVGEATERVHGAYGEIAALVALGDFGDATDIANAALLPEDRLQALGIVARGMRESQLSVAPEVEEAIDQLADQVPTRLPWEQIINLAIRIFDVRPQTAVALLERCAGAGEGRVLDHALAALSLTSNRSDSAEELQTRIQDEALRDFVRAKSPALAVMKPEEVISQASAVNDISARLFLLRDWCNSNRNSPEAHLVITRALNWITEATSYTPSLRVLRQIAEPLRSVSPAIATSIIEKLLSLKESLPDHPAEERIRLELLIAELESHAAHEVAASRLLDAYAALDSIADLDIRTHGIAHVLLSLRAVDPGDVDNFRSDVLKSLRASFDALLAGSADHAEVARRIIRSATSFDFDLGLEMAAKLNLEDRREEAYAEAIEVYCDGNNQSFDLSRALEACERIKDVHATRGPTVVLVARQLAGSGRVPKAGDYDLLSRAITSLPDPYDRAFAHAWTARWMASMDQQASDVEIDQAEQAAHSIDEPWKARESLFGIVRVIAPTNASRARHLLQQLRSNRSGRVDADAVFGPLYASSLLLAVYATLGLAETDHEIETTLAPLVQAINSVPSLLIQGDLLARIATRLYLADKHKVAEQYSQRVQAILDQLEDPHARNELFISAAPALFTYDPNLLKSLAGDFQKETREHAIYACIRYILSKSPPDVPIRFDQLQVSIDYRTARTVGELLDMLEVDSHVVDSMRTLVNVILLDPWHPALNPRQLRDLARDLEATSSKRLPDPRNIQHRGFEILALVQIERLRYAAANPKPKRSPWTQLLKDIESIPNVADQAYVLAQVAEDIFKQWPDEAQRMLQQAEALVPSICNQYDRAYRMWSVADAYSQGNDLKSARFLLEKAFNDIRNLSNSTSVASLADQIVESAHSLSPQFAASLTPLIDDKLRRFSLEEKSRAFSAHKQPANVSWEGDQRAEPEVLRRAAHESRRSLAAGRAGAQSDLVLLRWLRSVMSGNFRDVVEVAAWVVENLRAGQRGRQMHKEVFDGLLENIRFARAFGDVLAGSGPSPTEGAKQTGLPDHMQLFRAGSRETALVNVANWIGSHAEGYLIISDPFFSVSDLEILRAVPHGVEVQILTSWKAQTGFAGKRDGIVPVNELPQWYTAAWKRTTDTDPPPSIVTVLCTKSYKSPLHDRYILTKSGGLRLGTSVGGLGNKDCEVSILDAEEANGIEVNALQRWLQTRVSEFQGERLVTCTFPLGETLL